MQKIVARGCDFCISIQIIKYYNEKILISLVAVGLTIGISLRQGQAQEATLSESLQPDGTKVGTIHLGDVLDSQLKSKSWLFFAYDFHVKDPLISPPISLALGEKVIIRIVGRYYDPFFFDPNENNLSILTPTYARDGLQNHEPCLTRTAHYCKYWTATALARIFHTHRDEEAAKVDEARRTKDFDAGLYVSYRSNQNSSPTQHSSAFPASTVDGYEIFGLGADVLVFHSGYNVYFTPYVEHIGNDGSGTTCSWDYFLTLKVPITVVE